MLETGTNTCVASELGVETLGAKEMSRVEASRARDSSASVLLG